MLANQPNLTLRLCLCCFFCLIMTSTSHAFTSWQGSYLGAYLGGGYASQDINTHAGSVNASSYFSSTSDTQAVSRSGSPNNTTNNAIFGVSVGHDIAWHQWVYGAVVDLGAMPINTTHTTNQATLPSSGDTYTLYTAMSTNWLMTLRGRLGCSTILFQHPSLIYASGGLAISQVKINNHYSDNSALSGLGSSQAAENLLGWAAGVGLEMATFDNATMNIEYLYIQFPGANTTANISNSVAGFGIPQQSLTSPLTSSGSMSASLIRFGINYRFDV